MDSALSLILLTSDMQKCVDATNKCLPQDTSGKCPRTTEDVSKYTAVRE